MLDVAEALQRVLEQAQPLPPKRLPLAETLGRVLAEPVLCDLDSPPYDKSIVDGYAVRLADLQDGCGELAILEEVTAGAVPQRALSAGTATRLMTGAPIPRGADAVVMIERTSVVPGGATPLGRVRIEQAGVSPQRTNILRRGAAMRCGEPALSAGTVIEPAHVGLLAELGRATAAIVPPARVAVLSTGDELVPLDRLPGPGQIRNSNGPMLAALVRRAGATPVELGIAYDRPDELREYIRQGLDYDVLLLSGGVSAGVHDLAPGVLQELGVRQVFHKVRVKPGKPLWFGVCEGPPSTTLVFGLPGNPVSSFVCFLLFAQPALRKLQGHLDAAPQALPARLTAAFRHRGDRPTYHPARLTADISGLCWQAEALRWAGSADLRGLAEANGLIHFPAGDRDYAAGDALQAFAL